MSRGWAPIGGFHGFRVALFEFFLIATQLLDARGGSVFKPETQQGQYQGGYLNHTRIPHKFHGMMLKNGVVGPLETRNPGTS